MPRIIDLFAGLGGIRLGFQQAMQDQGLTTDCVFSSEIKPYAIKAYNEYFGNETIHGDITEIKTVDIPDFDFLCAGFPCQPFSAAGGRRGFADTRGTLFFEIERILKEKKKAGHPAMGFILENVEGLMNHAQGKTLNTILHNLKQLKYKVSYELIDAQYFGLAQSRKRVYIVGTLDETIPLDKDGGQRAVVGDILEHGKPLVDSPFTRLLLKNYDVSELPGKAIKDKRGGKDNIHSWDISLKGEVSQKERDFLNRLLKERRKRQWADIIGIKWMDGMPLTEDMIRTFYNDPELHDMLEHLTELGYLVLEHPKQQVEDESGSLIRVPDTSLPKGYNIVAGKLSFEFTKILSPDEVAPTLVAMDVSKLGVVDGNGIRRLTIRECQRLCGYPDNYSLDMVSEKDAFDLLGNTVCVPVIKQIASKLGDYYIRKVQQNEEEG